MVICYNKTVEHEEGIWQIENATNHCLPVFDLQLSIILSISLLLVFAFKSFRLPRISAQMLVSIFFFFPE